VEEQVVVIFAAVNGYLDKVKESALVGWEKAYLTYIHEQHPEILSSIVKEQKIVDDNITALKAAIVAFNDIHDDWMMEG
jgi:F-type H+-transporting ATPase subunit alpha